MKTLVIFYSFSGRTKKEAEKIAAAENADLCEVREVKKRNIITAFIPGCPKAIKRTAPAVQPFGVKPGDYDRILIGAPVWAGFPAPAFNSIVNTLPQGREVGVFLTSSSGDTSKSADGTKKLIEAKGCRLIEYKDIVTASKKK